MGEKNSTKDTIFGIVSKLSYRLRTKITAIAAILPIILILLTVLYGYSSIQTEKEYSNAMLKEIRESEINLIKYAIVENNDKAKLQTETIKSDISSDLLEAYGNNTERMKRDFNSLDTNTDFYKILAKNIDGKYINKSNDNNRVFIATKNGVLIDDSISYVANSFTQWDNIIENTPNKFIAEDALEVINRTKSREVVLWIDNTSLKINNREYSNKILYNANSSSLDFIESCVNSGNIDELLQYSVIVCSYIYNNEDPFGVPNVETGKVNDNDVLYVIQVYSIKDMIYSNQYLMNTLSKYEYMANNNYQKYENIIHYKTIAVLVFCILEGIAFFCVWYLAEFFIYFHNNKDPKVSMQRRKRKED